MIGKLAAGLVCGAAAAFPARYVLETTMGGFRPFTGEPSNMDTAILLAPFAVVALVVVVCVIAPSMIGAWVRGCLIATGVGAVTTLQALQCFGLDWLFREMFNDRAAREAATVACPDSLTPMISAVIAAGAVAFGIAALLIWRNSRRGEEL